MSPVVLPPVSTPYCSLSRAPPPVSVMYQPVGSVVLVVDPAVLLSVSKFSVTGVPSAVRLTELVPVSRARGWLRTTCAVSGAEMVRRNATTDVTRPNKRMALLRNHHDAAPHTHSLPGRSIGSVCG